MITAHVEASGRSSLRRSNNNGGSRLLSDCARICLVAADFMVRQSDAHTKLCGLSAGICRRCADACERIDSSDHAMAACAAECRRCAESCAEMAAAA